MTILVIIIIIVAILTIGMLFWCMHSESLLAYPVGIFGLIILVLLIYSAFLAKNTSIDRELINVNSVITNNNIEKNDSEYIVKGSNYETINPDFIITGEGNHILEYKVSSDFTWANTIHFTDTQTRTILIVDKSMQNYQNDLKIGTENAKIAVTALYSSNMLQYLSEETLEELPQIEESMLQSLIKSNLTKEISLKVTDEDSKQTNEKLLEAKSTITKLTDENTRLTEQNDELNTTIKFLQEKEKETNTKLSEYKMKAFKEIDLSKHILCLALLLIVVFIIYITNRYINYKIEKNKATYKSELKIREKLSLEPLETFEDIKDKKLKEKYNND